MNKARKLFKNNLKKAKFQSIKHLQDNQIIAIKPGDKGKAIVIMGTQMCIDECMGQLNNRNYYKKLDHDPTREYQQQIKQVTMEATNLNIIIKM